MGSNINMHYIKVFKYVILYIYVVKNSYSAFLKRH